MKTIYLANPYGFSPTQRAALLPPIIGALEKMGFEVWEPFSRCSSADFTRPEWVREVGQQCLSDVRNADAIFAIVNGCPPDEGVMFELGYAVALGKPFFLFRDDFRKCTDSNELPLNLMAFVGLQNHEDWRARYFTSLNDLNDKRKQLYAFAPRQRPEPAAGQWWRFPGERPYRLTRRYHDDLDWCCEHEPGADDGLMYDSDFQDPRVIYCGDGETPSE